jgi:hypothetical protein
MNEELKIPALLVSNEMSIDETKQAIDYLVGLYSPRSAMLSPTDKLWLKGIVRRLNKALIVRIENEA